jgi:hypothetical protein
VPFSLSVKELSLYLTNNDFKADMFVFSADE